jgi:hypothetical protein
VAKPVHRDFLPTNARVQDVYNAKRIKGYRLSQELASQIDYSASCTCDGLQTGCEMPPDKNVLGFLCFVLGFCSILPNFGTDQKTFNFVIFLVLFLRSHTKRTEYNFRKKGFVLCSLP